MPTKSLSWFQIQHCGSLVKIFFFLLWMPCVDQTEAHLSTSCPLIQANEAFQELVTTGTGFHYPKEFNISDEPGDLSVHYLL